MTDYTNAELEAEDDFLARQKLGTLPATTGFCHGCDWAASGYTHRHSDDLDGSRVGCCAHSCACAEVGCDKVATTSFPATSFTVALRFCDEHAADWRFEGAVFGEAHA